MFAVFLIQASADAKRTEKLLADTKGLWSKHVKALQCILFIVLFCMIITHFF